MPVAGRGGGLVGGGREREYVHGVHVAGRGGGLVGEREYVHVAGRGRGGEGGWWEGGERESMYM